MGIWVPKKYREVPWERSKLNWHHVWTFIIYRPFIIIRWHRSCRLGLHHKNFMYQCESLWFMTVHTLVVSSELFCLAASWFTKENMFNCYLQMHQWFVLLPTNTLLYPINKATLPVPLSVCNKCIYSWGTWGCISG